MENDNHDPSVGTVRKVAEALNLPLSLFFSSRPSLDCGDRCPVTLTGGCILDELSAETQDLCKPNGGSYTPEQLQILQQCNYLLHSGDNEILSTLRTTITSLMISVEPVNGNRS
jgi:hypothetical protein